MNYVSNQKIHIVTYLWTEDNGPPSSAFIYGAVYWGITYSGILHEHKFHENITVAECW